MHGGMDGAPRREPPPVACFALVAAREGGLAVQILLPCADRRLHNAIHVDAVPRGAALGLHCAGRAPHHLQGSMTHLKIVFRALLHSLLQRELWLELQKV